MLGRAIWVRMGFLTGKHLLMELSLDYATARNLLGPSAYIGISAANITEAVKALNDISDVYADPETTYLGLGPVYATATKPDHKPPMGPEGIREILQSLSAHKFSGTRASRPLPDTQFVAIGGINRENLYDVLYHGEPTPEFKEQQQKSVCLRIFQLRGVAVVSAIMASPTPEITSRELRSQINTTFTLALAHPILPDDHTSQSAFDLIKSIPTHTPLVHHITNSVVKDFSANVTLAIGASPIMSENPMEMKDLAAITSGFVLNMGTSLPEFELAATKAIVENNRKGNPIVFDPVGAGATNWRRELSHRLVEIGYFDVIKGNRGEILTIAGTEDIVMRGVDDVSVDGATPLFELARVVKDLALKESTSTSGYGFLKEMYSPNCVCRDHYRHDRKKRYYQQRYEYLCHSQRTPLASQGNWGALLTCTKTSVTLSQLTCCRLDVPLAQY